MKGFLRRLRGILGTGLIWAIGWAALWSVLLIVVVLIGLATGDTSLLGRENLWGMLKMVFNVGKFGFLGGTAFGAVFSVFERHKNLKEISYKRVGLSGILGGLAVLALLSVIYGTPVVSVVYGVLGIISAAGTVALAKQADNRFIEGEDDLPALEGE